MGHTRAYLKESLNDTLENVKKIVYRSDTVKFVYVQLYYSERPECEADATVLPKRGLKACGKDVTS